MLIFAPFQVSLFSVWSQVGVRYEHYCFKLLVLTCWVAASALAWWCWGTPGIWCVFAIKMDLWCSINLSSSESAETQIEDIWGPVEGLIVGRIFLPIWASRSCWSCYFHDVGSGRILGLTIWPSAHAVVLGVTASPAWCSTSGTYFCWTPRLPSVVRFLVDLVPCVGRIPPGSCNMRPRLDTCSWDSRYTVDLDNHGW